MVSFSQFFCNNILTMEAPNPKNNLLCVKSVTWYKDSHSLFDYEATKVQNKAFTFPANTKYLTFYRLRQSSNIIAIDDTTSIAKHDLENYQLLTHFEIKQNSTNKLRLQFDHNPPPKIKKINSQRLNTDESISSYCDKEEETYLIVRRIKDINNQQKGYKLVPGQIIKLGRVEYFVSEVKEGNNLIHAMNKQTINGGICNRMIMKYDPNYQSQTEKNACKICLEDCDTPEDFLFNPCKCSGSCGSIHISCLTQWINIKVKKQVKGGTLHFNFNKFECQVCKEVLPMVIDVNGTHRELLPIEKPEGNYLILQGTSEKTKSVMIIQNVPPTGIKLGRGGQCQIRITDISVSRNHAQIKSVGNSFYIFDNKSKFGTLVKDEKMNLEVTRQTRGVQIGRTTLNFQLKRRQSRSEQSQRIKTVTE